MMEVLILSDSIVVCTVLESEIEAKFVKTVEEDWCEISADMFRDFPLISTGNKATTNFLTFPPHIPGD